MAVQLDALIVGAGFGGTYQLHKLRSAGYNVKLIDSALDFGGVWHWNCYPGVRVDSPIPMYEFSLPELWTNWTWKERFPSGQELQDYFAYVADKLDLRKDAIFGEWVSSAVFDQGEGRWVVETDKGSVFKVRYLLLNVGSSTTKYVPPFKGLDAFKGQLIIPSRWKKGTDLSGRKIAIIGTGPTGLQLIQEMGKIAKELVVFQRTPSLALPLGQVSFSGKDQSHPKSKYPEIFDGRNHSYGGFDYNFLPKGTFDDTPEQRRAVYEELWKQGDFKYWLATYHDMLFDKAANKEAYDFWCEKTRARIHDPRARDLLAPLVQPYSFGCKRVPLEQGYYEVFNQANVHLVDLHATPIEVITETGIKTPEKEWEFDAIIMATGYNAVIGSLISIDIRGPSGESISEKWKDGMTTFLGMATKGFPNMFFTYGPQAPTVC